MNLELRKAGKEFMILALEKDDGSLFVFASITEAELEFEAIDVENDEYEFCDHTGQPFIAKITAPVTTFRAGSYRLQPSGAPDKKIFSRIVSRASCLARSLDHIRTLDDLKKANAA